MNREHLTNTLSPLFVVGFLLMTAWGNAWAMVIYGLLGVVAGYFAFSQAERKACMKVMVLSGLVACIVAIMAVHLVK